MSPNRSVHACPCPPVDYARGIHPDLSCEVRPIADAQRGTLPDDPHLLPWRYAMHPAYGTVVAVPIGALRALADALASDVGNDSGRPGLVDRATLAFEVLPRVLEGVRWTESVHEQVVAACAAINAEHGAAQIP